MKHTDTDNSVVMVEGRWRWAKGEEVGTLLGVMGAQCSVQMMFY